VKKTLIGQVFINKLTIKRIFDLIVYIFHKVLFTMRKLSLAHTILKVVDVSQGIYNQWFNCLDGLRS
jgi:hypothetical protein